MRSQLFVTFVALPLLYSAAFAAGKTNNPCEILVDKNTKNKLPETSQVVVVRTLPESQALASLCQWQGKTWYPVFTANFKAIIGKNGLAAVGAKKEGDLKTPQGLFPIGDVFGSKPMKLKMNYKYITADDKFIDDINSKEYNTWVTGPTLAKSYESMLIPAYQVGAVVNYNVKPIVKGAGSAIFLHLWENQNTPTHGCIATDKKHLLAMLHWLDKRQRPYIMIY